MPDGYPGASRTISTRYDASHAVSYNAMYRHVLSHMVILSLAAASRWHFVETRFPGTYNSVQ